MTVRELIRFHRYAEAIVQLQQALANNPNDMSAVYDMGCTTMTPGSAAWQIDIACLHWLSNDRSKATLLMHSLAVGILDGSVKYASDAAGGMNQGLLLYYMGVTANMSEEVSFAEDYLRNRVDYLKKVMRERFDDIWPCRVAQHLLGEIEFEAVMESVNRQPVSLLLTEAKAERGRRRRLCVALFYNGVRAMVQGKHGDCIARMWECYELDSLLLEQEWYLARDEVKNYRRSAIS